ncbi:MAG: ATP-binding protein [Candidatus Micrarchaeia archaeon]
MMKLNLVEKICGLIKGKHENRFSMRIGTSMRVLKMVHAFAFQYQKPPVHEYTYRWKRWKRRLSIYPGEEPNPHIVMAGMSGIGKSTLLRSMLKDMRSGGVSCILFDSNNEHESLVKSIGGAVIDASHNGINLLGLDGSTIGDRIDELTGLLKGVFNLGYLQAMKLNSCLWYTYMHKGARSRSESYMEREPTIHDLLEELSVFIRLSKGVQESNSLRSMYQKLSMLQRGAFRQGSMNIGSIASGISSFSLASVGSERVRILYISELLRRLYHHMHAAKKEQGVSMYVVLDESQLILGDEAGARIIGNIIEEGRKFGFGAIIISHMSSMLDKRIIANASTFMSFYAKEPSEINYVSSVLSGALPEMQNAIKEKLRTLGKHEALLTCSAHRMPVLVSTARLFANSFYGAESGAGEERVLSLLVQPMKRAALESVADVKALGGVLERLKASNAIESFTENGEEWLMKYSKVLSIEHEVRIRKIAERLRSCGIGCVINISHKGPDIVAQGAAIEYETGLKSIAATKQMLAGRVRYRKTVVVVSDPHAGAYSGISGAVQYSVFMNMDCASLRGLILS